jgi:hypothetical protein
MLNFRSPRHSVPNSKAPVAIEIVRKCAYSIRIAKDYQYSGLPSFFKTIFARVATQDHLTRETFKETGRCDNVL